MSSERRQSDLRNLVSGLYTVGETIGTGHFSVVKLARHVFTEKDVAVKVIDKTKLDDISRAHLFQEVMCMKLVQHPNVVRLYEVIDTTNKLYLILELGDGGDMYDYIMKHPNGLNEPSARKYFRQICRALKYCHEMHVCHRDLKPENLVFFEKQDVFKLTDFGFSNQFSPGKKLLTSCGSLAYSAPEILLGDPYDAQAVDIWSLGVILFMLVTGHAPFQEANDSETVMMILDCCYKLPSNITSECQNLIHRMIVRDPEKRATLDKVMSDIWYRKCVNDDDNYFDDDQSSIDSLRLLSKDDQESIIQQMVDGNIAERDTIVRGLNENQYNHITATYYLLAEKLYHVRQTDYQQTVKRERRLLQPSNDRFTEQIGGFLNSITTFHFADVSLPITRRNSIDEEFDDTYESGKENLLSILATPNHSIDSTYDAVVPAEDNDERHSLQQRTPNINSATAQAMKIILEEDENPDSLLTEKSYELTQQLNNPSKLNKIIENDEDDKSLTNSAAISNDSMTTSGILRSNDLRSVVENKRRTLSQSCSSSDNEDNSNNCDTDRLLNQNQIHTSQPAQDNVALENGRGRSFSNIENVLNEALTNSQQQLNSSSNTNEYARRKSSSRTNSIVSTHRLLLNNLNDDANIDTHVTNSSTLINDRSRSLSTEHRFANQSQMSIGSRTSIRYSTPRESTVFTKAEAPAVIRLLQHTPHQDTNDAIRTIIDYQRLQQNPTYQEYSQPPIIVEEDISPSISNVNTMASIGKGFFNEIMQSNSIMATEKCENKANGNIGPPGYSKFTKLKRSLMRHQQEKISDDVGSPEKSRCEKNKHSGQRQRACCTIV